MTAEPTADPVILHELPPSPNNVKARIALGYQGVEYSRSPIDMQDPSSRERILEISGQPLTPVLQHGDRVIFDSHAIVRYVSANFPGPGLMFRDADAMRAGEDWERWFRGEMGPVLSMAFAEFFKLMQGGTPDGDSISRANVRWRELAGRIEEHLEDSDFLLGDELSFADAIGAPYILFASLPEPFRARSEPLSFFEENFSLGEGRERTRDWAARVLSHDPEMRVQGSVAG